MSAAGLYLHVPFCRRVCPYCDFAVRTGDRARRRRFVGQLAAEIALHEDSALEFDTIYFGGGTPSHVEPEGLEAIVAAARRHLAIDGDARIFFEANPEDVTAESAAAWRALGVGTLSLGVQSFDPAALEFLGRQHDPSGARRAVEIALDAGFATVSIDLIYGLPGQDATAWRRELDTALGLGVQHLSCYQLTIHDRTRFGLLERRGRLCQLDPREQGTLFRLTHRHLHACGYPGYEVSNFASAPEHRSRHNLKYWCHAPYLGLGPSAHSFAGRRRSWNLRRADAWAERIEAGQRPIEGGETLDDRALALEALMLGLRTCDGVDLERVRGRFGVDLVASNAPLVEWLAAQGYAAIDGGRLVPSIEGLAVADSLAAQFEIETERVRT